MSRRSTAAVTALLALTLSPQAALAAPTLDGASMNLPWALPFAGILLSIATVPLLFPKIWPAHYGKIATGWAFVTVATLAVSAGIPAALAAFIHAALVPLFLILTLLPFSPIFSP